jgi:hypothetical protein
MLNSHVPLDIMPIGKDDDSGTVSLREFQLLCKLIPAGRAAHNFSSFSIPPEILQPPKEMLDYSSIPLAKITESVW